MGSLERMNIYQIYELLQSFYGYKCSMVQLNEEKGEIKFILYDSFQVGCDVNDRYRRFGAGLKIGKRNITTTFLGKKRSLNNNRESIKETFQIIDDYCRAALPDKFLEAYDKAYLIKDDKEELFLESMEEAAGESAEQGKKNPFRSFLEKFR